LSLNVNPRWPAFRRLQQLAVLTCACVTFSTLTPPAHAEIYTCGTGPKSVFDGYTNASNDPNSYEGTSATIVVRRGAVCDTDTSSGNISIAWTMIASNGGTGGWAQSGYYRWYGSSIYHFAQFRQTTSSKLYTKIGTTALTAGSAYRYWQQTLYNSTAGQWQIRDNVNSTILLQTNFNTFTAWTTPLSVQFEGETKYAASDVPGSSSAPASFTGMQVQRYSDDQWTSTLPALYGPATGQTSTRYKRSSVSNNAFNIWTG
jgi:hypothetical protein